MQNNWRTVVLQDERTGWMPGSRIGDQYTVIEEIGRGGSGITYKVEKDGKISILKEIYPMEFSRDFLRGSGGFLRLTGSYGKELIGRLKDEAAEEIQYTNYIKYDLESKNVKRNAFGASLADFSANEAELALFIETETCSGCVLSEWMQQMRCLDTDTYVLQMTGLLYQIVTAVRDIHEKGLLHLDIKPENIFVPDKNQAAVILDYGSAICLNRKAGLRHISCSHGYSAPELHSAYYHLLKGDSENMDMDSIGIPTDLYSIGTIIYEAFTGDLFDHSRKYASVSRKISESLKDGRNACYVDGLLAGLLHRSLAFSVKKRYQSDSDMLDDILHIRNILNKTAEPDRLIHVLEEEYLERDSKADPELFGELVTGR